MANWSRAISRTKWAFRVSNRPHSVNLGRHLREKFRMASQTAASLETAKARGSLVLTIKYSRASRISLMQSRNSVLASWHRSLESGGPSEGVLIGSTSSRKRRSFPMRRKVWHRALSSWPSFGSCPISVEYWASNWASWRWTTSSRP